MTKRAAVLVVACQVACAGDESAVESTDAAMDTESDGAGSASTSPNGEDAGDDSSLPGEDDGGDPGTDGGTEDGGEESSGSDPADPPDPPEPDPPIGLCDPLPDDVGTLVDGPNALAGALASASAGDVLRLAPGDYGTMPAIPDGLTLMSDEPDDPARFTRAIVHDLNQVTFEGLLFDYVFQPGDADTVNHFSFNHSTDLTIRLSTFDGDADPMGRYRGRGLRILHAIGLVVECNEFSKFWTGAGIGHGGTTAPSEDALVYGNDVHTIRSDGFKFGDNINLRVERNYIHDFGGASNPSDHRDMVQVSGVVDGLAFVDNLFDMADGYYSQTLWSDGMGKKSNVTVEGNVVLNAHTHGISMHNVQHVHVIDNILAPVPREETGGVTIPKINLSAWGDVQILDNITPGILDPNPAWTVQGNTIVELDHEEVRMDAQADPRWAPFFP